MFFASNNKQSSSNSVIDFGSPERIHLAVAEVDSCPRIIILPSRQRNFVEVKSCLYSNEVRIFADTLVAYFLVGFLILRSENSLVMLLSRRYRVRSGVAVYSDSSCVQIREDLAPFGGLEWL